MSDDGMNHIYISWDEFLRDCRRFAGQVLLGSAPHEYSRGIVAVARGGMIPAAIVARELDIRMVNTVCVEGYQGMNAKVKTRIVGPHYSTIGTGAGWLIIDDLVDSGATAGLLHRLFPNAIFGTIYAKPLGRVWDNSIFIRMYEQTDWLHFPWEVSPQHHEPIKGDG